MIILVFSVLNLFLVALFDSVGCPKGEEKKGGFVDGPRGGVGGVGGGWGGPGGAGGGGRKCAFLFFRSTGPSDGV